MGRYGAYAPHTVEYQIYRGEATDSCDGGEMLRNQIMYFTLVFTEKTSIQKNRKE